MAAERKNNYPGELVTIEGEETNSRSNIRVRNQISDILACLFISLASDDTLAGMASAMK